MHKRMQLSKSELNLARALTKSEPPRGDGVVSLPKREGTPG